MGLPSGYKQLEYIATSGTQYINTGFYPNQNTRVVMRYQLTNLNSAWQGIFSSRDGSSASYGNNFSLWATASGNYRTDYGPDDGPTFGTLDTNEHTVDKNKNTTTIGSDTSTNDAAAFQCNYPLHLATGYSGGAAEYPASVQIYACQIYDDGTLVRDYIPVLRMSDSTPGLYDLCNDVFYTNAGSGAFDYAMPTAKHGTSIGGAAYEITGGQAMVDGTVYSIAKGRTMVDGTLYDIPFARDVTIEITGNGIATGKTCAYVTIDGTTYTSEATLQVPAGTEITCGALTSITRNGTGVSNPYTFQAEQDVTIGLTGSMTPHYSTGLPVYSGTAAITG